MLGYQAVREYDSMCGIAEFRCKNLTNHTNLLRDVAHEFTYSIDKIGTDRDLVSVSSYHDHCLCDPTPEERQQFLKIIEILLRNSEELVYSPNDYSDDPSQCFEETWSAEEVVEHHWPSLETPPMRITIRP